MGKQENKKEVLPNWAINPKEKKGKVKVATTQTQTFETEFLTKLVEILNQKKGLTLEVPTTNLKGTKKTLFKFCFGFLLESLELNPNQIKEVLRLGKYVR